MLKFAKVLIMLVRLAAIIAIVLGILLLSPANASYVPIHIGIGFLLTSLVIVLAILALAKGAVGPGIVGIVVAFLLPYVGLKQFPLAFGFHLGWIQIAHVLVAVITLGIAEMLHGAIRKAG